AAKATSGNFSPCGTACCTACATVSECACDVASGRNKPLLAQILQHDESGLVGLERGCVDGDLGVERGLVRAINASEVFQFAGPGLLVEALGITRLAGLDGRGHVDLDECQAVLDVEVAAQVAVLAIGADEAGHGEDAGVGEEPGDLADAADVLLAVG